MYHRNFPESQLVATSALVPCVYIFRGKKHLEKLIVFLAELKAKAT